MVIVELVYLHIPSPEAVPGRGSPDLAVCPDFKTGDCENSREQDYSGTADS